MPLDEDVIFKIARQGIVHRYYENVSVSVKQLNDLGYFKLEQIEGSYEDRNHTLLFANADYEARKAAGEKHQVSIRRVERHWKLNPGKLTSFRQNQSKRKVSYITSTRKNFVQRQTANTIT